MTVEEGTIHWKIKNMNRSQDHSAEVVLAAAEIVVVAVGYADPGCFGVLWAEHAACYSHHG